MQLYLSLRSLVLDAQTAPSPTGTEVQVKRMLAGRSARRNNEMNQFLNQKLASKIIANITALPDIEIEIITEYIGKNEKVLELGFGNGKLIKELSNLGYSKLHGLDESSIFVNHLKIDKKNAKICLIEHDFISWNEGFEVDAIIAFHFFTSIIDDNIRNIAIEKAFCMLKKNGILIVKSFYDKLDKYIKCVQNDVDVEIFIPEIEKWKNQLANFGFSIEKEFYSRINENKILYIVLRKIKFPLTIAST